MLAARPLPMPLNRPTATLALWLAAAAVALAAQGTPSIPPELSDREFWTFVEELSERDGYFEDENYVSNEQDARDWRHDATDGCVSPRRGEVAVRPGDGQPVRLS